MFSLKGGRMLFCLSALFVRRACKFNILKGCFIFLKKKQHLTFWVWQVSIQTGLAAQVSAHPCSLGCRSSGQESRCASLVTEGTPGARAAPAARGFLSPVHLPIAWPSYLCPAELWEDGSQHRKEQIFSLSEISVTCNHAAAAAGGWKAGLFSSQ